MNASVDCDLRKERERENERTREREKREKEREKKKKRKNKIKKIEERTSVGCDEHRSNQAIPSSTKDIVLKLGARHRHCFNWMESCKKEGE